MTAQKHPPLWEDPQKARRAALDRVLASLRAGCLPSEDDLPVLSDLTPEEARAVRQVWPDTAQDVRRDLMARLCALLEEDLRYSFLEMARMAVDDPDPDVRAAGLRLLAVEDTEVRTVVPLLIRHLWDEDERVRAQAAESLGPFVLAGMTQDLPSKWLRRMVAALLHVLHETTPETPVWASALRSVSYADPRGLGDLLELAYVYGSTDLRCAALIAMGRTMNPRWHRYILADLQHTHPRVRAAAAEAAGFAEIPEALDDLLYLLTDAARDVRMAAAWAISEISEDEKHLDILEQALAQAEDDVERKALEAALSNLEFRLARGEITLMEWALKEDLDDEPRLDFRETSSQQDNGNEAPDT